MSAAIRTLPVMSETLIGYARCSTDTQDLTAQRDRLRELGVAEDRIYPDHGLTGTNRKRPGLDQALAAARGGDTFVVPKTGPARPVSTQCPRDRRRPGRPRHQTVAGRAGLRPGRPDGQDVLQHLATFAEFEVDLLRMRTREGMAVARAKGKLRGKQPNQPGWLANLAASISSVVVAELTAATAAALAPARTVLTVQARNRSSADWSTPKSLTAASASWRGWWGLSRRGRKPRDPAYRRCRLGRSSGR
jgi:hypothetical protein